MHKSQTEQITSISSDVKQSVEMYERTGRTCSSDYAVGHATLMDACETILPTATLYTLRTA